MNKRLDEVHEINNITINDFINNQKFNERLINLMFMFLGGILLLLVKEVFFKYEFSF